MISFRANGIGNTFIIDAGNSAVPVFYCSVMEKSLPVAPGG